MPHRQSAPSLPHARDRVDAWAREWRDHGSIVVLLDFDGTLAPIVDRPEMAAIPSGTRVAVERLIACRGAHVSVVSGRGLADARSRAGLAGIAYAGNHGLEIAGPGLSRVHPAAAAARPRLEEVMRGVSGPLGRIPGAILEDKGLTLSIHYRLVVRALVGRVRRLVEEAATEVDGVRVTEGKEVLEVRPDVDWHKGRAVEYLLDSIRPPVGSPLLYIGDDRTDEDAFAFLRSLPGGEGVIVAETPPTDTAARAFVRNAEEVAEVVDLLVQRAPA